MFCESASAQPQRLRRRGFDSARGEGSRSGLPCNCAGPARYGAVPRHARDRPRDPAHRSPVTRAHLGWWVAALVCAAVMGARLVGRRAAPRGAAVAGLSGALLTFPGILLARARRRPHATRLHPGADPAVLWCALYERIAWVLIALAIAGRDAGPADPAHRRARLPGRHLAPRCVWLDRRSTFVALAVHATRRRRTRSQPSASPRASSAIAPRSPTPRRDRDRRAEGARARPRRAGQRRRCTRCSPARPGMLVGRDIADFAAPGRRRAADAEFDRPVPGEVHSTSCASSRTSARSAGCRCPRRRARRPPASRCASCATSPT